MDESALSRLQQALRVLALLVALGLPAGLWWGGGQPVAVGLLRPPWDKLAHAGVFAILACAIGYASGWRGGRMLLAGFVGAMLVGLVDEWHQLHLPGRSAGLDDLAADAVGAAMGSSALLIRDRARAWLLR